MWGRRTPGHIYHAANDIPPLIQFLYVSLTCLRAGNVAQIGSVSSLSTVPSVCSPISERTAFFCLVLIGCRREVRAVREKQKEVVHTRQWQGFGKRGRGVKNQDARVCVFGVSTNFVRFNLHPRSGSVLVARRGPKINQPAQGTAARGCQNVAPLSVGLFIYYANNWI